MANLAFNGKTMLFGGKRGYIAYDPFNPLKLPPFTMRIYFNHLDTLPPANPWYVPEGTVWTRVSVDPNVWDMYYPDPDWGGGKFSIGSVGAGEIAILGANVSNVTNFKNFTNNDGKLTDVALFDVRNADVREMFKGCAVLKNAPDFTICGSSIEGMFMNCFSLVNIPELILTDAPNVDLTDAFNGCPEVEHGMYSFYNRYRDCPSHRRCFAGCGVNTMTGQAERELIPDDWKNW